MLTACELAFEETSWIGLIDITLVLVGLDFQDGPTRDIVCLVPEAGGHYIFQVVIGLLVGAVQSGDDFIFAIDLTDMSPEAMKRRIIIGQAQCTRAKHTQNDKLDKHCYLKCE